LDDPYGASVSAAPNGGFLVVWTKDSNRFVSAQQLDRSGVRIGGELQVAISTSSIGYRTYLRAPRAVYSPSGNFVIVWRRIHFDEGIDDVVGLRFASSGQPIGEEFIVDTSTNYWIDDTNVSTDPFGNFVVVWNHRSQSYYFPPGPAVSVHARRYDSLAVPLGDEFVVSEFTSFVFWTGAVSHDSEGGFVIVYSAPENGSLGGRRFDSGGSAVGEEFHFNSFTLGGAYNAAIDHGPEGNFVVTWTNYDGWYGGIAGQRFNSLAQRIGEEFQVNEFWPLRQDTSRVATDMAGGFVVVWESREQDGWEWGGFGRRFNSVGQPLGPEFQINVFTFSYQRRPSLARASDGQFMVVWDSNHQDHWRKGIFGRSLVNGSLGVGNGIGGASKVRLWNNIP
jgi:hypothetical protein